MALLLVDGCDHYDTANLQSGTGVYQLISGNPTVLPTSGRFGGPCISCAFGHGVGRVFKVNQQDFIQGCWVYGNGSSVIFTTRAVAPNTTTVAKIQLLVTSNNALQATFANFTVIGTSANGVFPLNQWNWVVWKVHMDTVAGSVGVWVNNTQVMNLTGVDTASDSNGNALYIGSAHFGNFTLNLVNFMFDDLFIFELSGTTCNSVPNKQRIRTSLTSGPGAHTDFTPFGSVSNWANVNQVPPDEDTTYNVSNNIGDRDSFAHTPITGVTNVTGAQIFIRSTVDDAHKHQLQATYTSNGVDALGLIHDSTSTYAEYLTDASIDPNTGNLWASIPVLNASEIGYKLVD